MFGGLGWLEGWWADWSEMVGFVQLWLGFGGIGEVFGAWSVDQLVVGKSKASASASASARALAAGRSSRRIRRYSRQCSGDGAVVDLVEASDLGGRGVGQERRDSAAVGEEGEGFEGFGGVFLQEAVDVAAEQGDVLEEEVVGGLLGEVGPIGLEELEIGVDGGVGDVEGGGDLAEGLAGLAEFVGVEDASASFWGCGHCVRTYVLMGG